MAVSPPLADLLSLGQALEEARPGDAGPDSPLEQGRLFLLTHLPQEASVPYRADDLLELLKPSPHMHGSWAQERELVLEGLTLLHQLWRR